MFPHQFQRGRVKILFTLKILQIQTFSELNPPMVLKVEVSPLRRFLKILLLKAAEIVRA